MIIKVNGASRCDHCGLVANPGYQIRNRNGIESASYCCPEHAKLVMAERGKAPRQCQHCFKTIPKTIRELYPKAIYCSNTCTDEARDWEFLS